MLKRNSPEPVSKKIKPLETLFPRHSDNIKLMGGEVTDEGITLPSVYIAN